MNLGMNYFSNSPKMFKINVIKNLLFRAYNISSNYVNMHSEFNFLKNYFKCNSFPAKLVDNQIKRFVNKIYEKEIISTVPKKVIYLRFPYFGYVSENIRKKLLPLLNRKFGHIDFKIAFKPSNTIGGMFRHKEALSDEMTSSVIYKYCCES